MIEASDHLSAADRSCIQGFDDLLVDRASAGGSLASGMGYASVVVTLVLSFLALWWPRAGPRRQPQAMLGKAEARPDGRAMHGL